MFQHIFIFIKSIFLMVNKKPVVGLVLSGGASRFFAQLGALQTLYEKGFRPDIIAGCSAGALLGVCLASGKDIKEISYFLNKQNPLKLLDPRIDKTGFLRGEKFVNSTLKFAGVKTFEELKLPLRVNSTNINKAEEISFSSGPLKPALNSTIAFPGIFVPYKHLNEYYVDGGVYNPLPIHLIPEADIIVAIDVSYYYRKIDDSSSALSVLKQAAYTLQKRIVDAEMEKFTLTKKIFLIKPLVEEFNFFEFRKKKYEDMEALGRKDAENALLDEKNSFIKQILK